MGQDSKIQWTHNTFNPWRGCSKVSPGCTNCYAETMSKRNLKVFGEWGPNGTRVIASEKMWQEPLKWNEEAKKEGVRKRVFCASLADVFEDRAELIEPRVRLFHLISETRNLDWLLLTKRPENIKKFYGDETHRRSWTESPPPNIWLGVSVEDQKRADKRIPILLQTPAVIHFLSCEPLLGDIKLDGFEKDCCLECLGSGYTAGHYFSEDNCGRCDNCHGKGLDENNPGIDWVIVGGESGSNARPFRVDWARSLRDQCKSAGVACFMKQMGSNIISRNDMIEDVFNNGHSGWPDPHIEHNIHGFREEYQGADYRIRLLDKKGGDMEEWPEDLRVREFPK